jgi:predicted dehydrogenase
VEICRQRRSLVQVNYWRRGDETFCGLRHSIIPTRIGKVQAAFGLYGNGLFNNGSHLIDLVRLALGEISCVQALAPAVPAHGSLVSDVQAPFALELEDGIVVAIQPLDFRHYREIGLDLWGTTGRLQIMAEGLTALLSPRRPNRGVDGADEIASDHHAILEPTVGKALRRMYDNLAAAFAAGQPLVSSGVSALATETAVHAVAEAAREGRKRLEISQFSAA